MFLDRKDAGQRLAQALLKFGGEDPVVLALPRGGVVLGYEIAKMLCAPLDLAITRKIGHPQYSEYAIAAVYEGGALVQNEDEVNSVDPKWFASAVEREVREIARRRRAYLGDRPPVCVEGKTAILADDGIATGLTMMAAIQGIRAHKPKRIVVAIPITPKDTAVRLRAMADELVSLEIDARYLGSVGAYYRDFRQVEDEEVIALLRKAL
jgi:predicted phosphoribosyltransferase